MYVSLTQILSQKGITHYVCIIYSATQLTAQVILLAPQLVTKVQRHSLLKEDGRGKPSSSSCSDRNPSGSHILLQPLAWQSPYSSPSSAEFIAKSK